MHALQKMPFRVVKERLSGCNMRPFTFRKAVYWKDRCGRHYRIRTCHLVWSGIFADTLFIYQGNTMPSVR